MTPNNSSPERPPLAVEEHVRAESVADGSSSGHATIVGSCHEELVYTPFPKYASVPETYGVPQIYCRSLLSSGNGFAPSNITGDVHRPEDHFKQGACIGDVGYVDEYGAFIYCFNIFHKWDDPIQPTDLTSDFTPFQPPLTPDDIKFTFNNHPPGTVVASEGINVGRVSESPLQIDFSSSKREGAVLILPTGASREDLIDPSKLYAYVKANAASWYQQCTRRDDVKKLTSIPNGTLQLVTGVDRADSWATATFPYRRTDARALRFQYLETNHPTWKNTAGLSALYRHQKESSVDGNLGAVFLRFMSIAIRPAQTTRDADMLSGSPSVPRYVLPTSQGTVRRSVIDRFRKPVKISPCPSEYIFNPSFMLLQILLRCDKDATVAIVPDSLWRSELNNKQMCHHELIGLIQRILLKNCFGASNEHGVAVFTLRLRTETTLQPPTSFWQKLMPCVTSNRSMTHDDFKETAALKEMTALLCG